MPLSFKSVSEIAHFQKNDLRNPSPNKTKTVCRKLPLSSLTPENLFSRCVGISNNKGGIPFRTITPSHQQKSKFHTSYANSLGHPSLKMSRKTSLQPRICAYIHYFERKSGLHRRIGLPLLVIPSPRFLCGSNLSGVDMSIIPEGAYHTFTVAAGLLHSMSFQGNDSRWSRGRHV